MLFSRTNYRGRGLYLYMSEPNLRRWGFNNDAQSVRISGHWKLCTKSYYQGHCEYVRYSRPTLHHMGLNRKITSVQFLGY